MEKEIIIYVEGTTEISFFEKIITPLFEKKGYDKVHINEYKGDGYIGDFKTIRRNICSFNRINSNPEFLKEVHYLFVTDLGAYPSPKQRKNKIKTHITNIEENNIVIVVVEIESWYLAGLDSNSSKKLGLKNYSKTDTITKKAFLDHIPRKFRKYKTALRQQILENFSIEVAKDKNKSFRFFCENYLDS